MTKKEKQLTLISLNQKCDECHFMQNMRISDLENKIKISARDSELNNAELAEQLNRINSLKLDIDNLRNTNKQIFKDLLAQHEKFDNYFLEVDETFSVFRYGIFVCCTLTLIASFALTYWMTT